MSNTLILIAKEVVAARVAADEAKEAKKFADELLDTVQKKMIDAMVEEGVASVRVDRLGNFSLRTRTFLNVVAANKERFYRYLKESGNGGLLKEDVNPRTLSAFLKTHLEELSKNFSEDGIDDFSANEKAVKFLNERGASYHTERVVAVTQ